MWRLDLDLDVIRNQAPRMDISPEEVSAEWVFDEGYATRVGITPDDSGIKERTRMLLRGC